MFFIKIGTVEWASIIEYLNYNISEDVYCTCMFKRECVNGKNVDYFLQNGLTICSGQFNIELYREVKHLDHKN